MISYQDAKDQYFHQFFNGRKKNHPSKDLFVFPFGVRYKDEEFIIDEFPVDFIVTRVRQPELIPQYAESISNGVDMPAVWLSVGRKLADGTMIFHWDRKVKVMDGFHRITATQSIGKKTVKAIMPKSHWDFYKELEVRDNGLYHKD